MSDHSVAFVPLGSGYHQSTDIFARGRPVDTGIACGSLGLLRPIDECGQPGAVFTTN